ncbi:hypothetical protein GTQ34_13320 [Muricauda sp. JGD-17]|uniref:Uncharacterized protein n=1 Tax=Flagellimonas ochracea TaxID=2696472 RepID=A0A964TDM1_9FLAO|nr:hypothetical protein [Allomuricauda ochracea]NAY92897.1 hypothetical protein [Allomuricauda ochracea]
MKNVNKIMLLCVAAILTVVGYSVLNSSQFVGITFICFLGASLFLLGYFGKSRVVFGFSKIMEFSSEIILGNKSKNIDTLTHFRIELLTISALFVCFGLGFGVGRMLYQILEKLA